MTCACENSLSELTPAQMSRSGSSALQQFPLREVSHQLTDAIGPRLALIAVAHAIDELAELRCCNRDDVVALVREPLPWRIAVLDRGEHGSQEQRKTIRVLVHAADGL